jgi:hypothetical protein
MGKKIGTALRALFDAKNSEFWGLVGMVVGTVVTSIGWLTWEQWNVWWPGILIYITGRFSSKVAKA